MYNDDYCAFTVVIVSLVGWIVVPDKELTQNQKCTFFCWVVSLQEIRNYHWTNIIVCWTWLRQEKPNWRAVSGYRISTGSSTFSCKIDFLRTICLLFLVQQVGIEWMTINEIVIVFSFKVDLQAKKENELQPKRAAGPQISPSEKASGWL